MFLDSHSMEYSSYYGQTYCSTVLSKKHTDHVGIRCGVWKCMESPLETGPHRLRTAGLRKNLQVPFLRILSSTEIEAAWYARDDMIILMT
ncbi:hypothetical protein MPTK1_6g08670 [Marchantia polymorpha subsp. ruderalis]|uniref:Uncharacterized protein n=2 Tax=Marchantia polymorpha TaxID=3197 RepID=A0AAF6BPZ4_MARPO|nr:hypothetical protein MARPO_0060s0054 [Marchantia polymorpha]BBN14078.1 hypothetical protein Mp_6g08670 [Marchantia polymorpha subsp. ruderalis]|eukprot:PTQ36967.1 hypothetical protein MARPO_0060s0054 [Marchantia polymorpha]